jgi:hypothetical protein
MAPAVAARRTAALLGLASLVVACSTGAGRYAGTLPGTRLFEMHRFWVEQAPSDERGLHLVVRDELRRLGFEAEAGAGPPPGEVDGVVTYVDRWTWDITTYCIQLTLYVRDTETGYITATGWSYRPSIVRKTPAGHARLILAEWFGETP